MEKQEKVLNKIKSIGTTGSGLNLGVKKDDECYTSMKDIFAELSYWANLGKFQGKNIICPCDWDITEDDDIYGIRIEYKESCVETNVFKTIKKVVVKKYNECISCEEETDVIELVDYELKEDEIEPFLRGLTCNFIRTFTQHARAWGIKSITASGYNPANGKGIPFQDVDYSKYDVCCTNPPFSLYSEFMKCMVGKIDFVILAPFMNRVAPCCIEPAMLNKVFIGTSGNTDAGYLALYFKNPTKDNQYHTKKVACDWLTSYPEAQLERNKKLLGRTTGVDYNLYKDEYEEMPYMTMKDNSHPIRVPADSIPDNYNGWMFGAINILTKISWEDYEWYCTACYGFFNKKFPDKNPFNHKLSRQIRVCKNGDKVFEGIVFRKKQK